MLEIFEETNIYVLKKKLATTIELFKGIQHALIVLRAFNVCTFKPILREYKEIQRVAFLLLYKSGSNVLCILSRFTHWDLIDDIKTVL